MSELPVDLLFPGADPSAVAVECGARSLTFAEVARRSVAFASLLRQAGLGDGDHAALLCRNRVEVFEVVLGSLLAGVWLTPVNWHLAPAEVAYILADCGAGLVVVDPAYDALVPATADALVLGDAYDGRLAAAPTLRVGASAIPGGTMMYTSGTSGQPKGVKRSKAVTLGDALAACRATARLVGFTEPGVHLVPGPLYHAAPLLFAVYDLLGGSSVLVMERWDTAQCLDLLQQRAVTHVHLVPTMMVRLMRLMTERGVPAHAGLRALLHGAAPIAPAVKHEAIRRFGPVLLEYWGATEGGVYTLVDSATWLARPGTVGQPLPSFEVYAVRGDEPPGDSEDARQGRVMSAPAQAGQRLPAGERGTLVCRHRLTDTPFVYHQDDAKTRAAYPSPGVFTVGDLGHVDADGFVYLSDRRSNLILSGGVNIYPAEVERVLAAHPDVTDVAVAGVPDAEWGERVVAVVEPRAGVAPDALERALRALCEAQLARFKHPVAYRLVPQLPRLPSGKVRRTDLAPLLLPATLGS